MDANLFSTFLIVRSALFAPLGVNGGSDKLNNKNIKYKTCVSSLIPLAKPKIPPLAISIITCFVLGGFEKWRRTDAYGWK